MCMLSMGRCVHVYIEYGEVCTRYSFHVHCLVPSAVNVNCYQCII